MRNIKLLLQYDGTNYAGWQGLRAPTTGTAPHPTIQDVIEERIARLTGQRSRLIASGRTDAGVHALGQAASFRTESALDAAVIKRALNALLPPDIRVVEAEDAADSFHPIRDAIGKKYIYLLSTGGARGPNIAGGRAPFIGRYIWDIRWRLDTDAMALAAGALAGRRDFRAFMGAGSSVKSTIREVRALTVERTDGLDFLAWRLGGSFLKITIEADGFLRHMARNIVGTLVDVGRGRTPASAVHEILKSADRRLAGPTAPPQGLFLEQVYY